MRSLWTAASGMIGEQFHIDTIANNLANINTTGFKKTRAEFEDLLYQTIRLAGTPSSEISQYPTGIQVGLGSSSCSHAEVLYPGESPEYRKASLILPSKEKAFWE